MLTRHLAALYVLLPQLDTINLRGVFFVCILGGHYTLGGSSDSGYSFQYSVFEMDVNLLYVVW